MKKGQSMVNIIIIIAVIIAVSFLAVTVLGGSNKEPVVDGQTKNLIVCSVKLDEDLFGKEVRIQNLNCVASKQCSFNNPLGIFTSEGNVEMVVNGLVLDSEKYETGLFDGKTEVELKACTSSPSGIIKVKSDSGEIYDSRSWSVN